MRATTHTVNAKASKKASRISFNSARAKRGELSPRGGALRNLINPSFVERGRKPLHKTGDFARIVVEIESNRIESNLREIGIVSFANPSDYFFLPLTSGRNSSSHCSPPIRRSSCRAKRGPTPVATERSGGGGGGTAGGIRKQGRSGEGSVGLSDRERANIFSASGAQPVITASIVCKWKLKKIHLTLWKGKHSSLRGERASCVFRAADISPGIVPPAPNRIEESAQVYRYRRRIILRSMLSNFVSFRSSIFLDFFFPTVIRNFPAYV